jgi:AraC-like DNA-binding protein
MQEHGTVGKGAFSRYLTYSEEDERWQIVCTDAGFNEVAPKTVYPPNAEDHPRTFKTVAVGRTFSEYQIVYVTRGRGEFRTGGRKFDVVPGSMMFLFPGVEHAYKPDFETGWTEYWVGFKGPYADLLCANGFISPDRPFRAAGLQNGILSLYSQIFDQVRNQEPLYQIKAGSFIIMLIAEILAGERRAAQSTHAEQLVAKAKFLMQENIDGEINLNVICDALGVSGSHLNEVFKSYMSMTPYQYFISIKIHRAKELLERGGLAVKEVAFQLGFNDEYYFSRLFKNKTGLSPSHWTGNAGE